MEQTAIPSQYLQISLDLAGRIARGELPEGSRIYGRSLMASEYNVSPETIRRSLRLLADMKVVEVKPQSGAKVLSADNARRYLSNFDEALESRTLCSELKMLLRQYDKMNRRLTEIVSALIQGQEAFSSDDSFPRYEVPIPEKSALIGKTIGALKFWQATGGTIVAIRRGQNMILSPGPYAELYDGDTLILVGTAAAAEAARQFVYAKEEPHDTV